MRPGAVRRYLTVVGIILVVVVAARRVAEAAAGRRCAKASRKASRNTREHHLKPGETMPAVTHTESHDWGVAVSHVAKVGDKTFFCVGAFKVTICDLKAKADLARCSSAYGPEARPVAGPMSNALFVCCCWSGPLVTWNSYFIGKSQTATGVSALHRRIELDALHPFQHGIVEIGKAARLGEIRLADPAVGFDAELYPHHAGFLLLDAIRADRRAGACWGAASDPMSPLLLCDCGSARAESGSAAKSPATARHAIIKAPAAGSLILAPHASKAGRNFRTCRRARAMHGQLRSAGNKKAGPRGTGFSLSRLPAARLHAHADRAVALLTAIS